MLAWVMNLGFAASSYGEPALTEPDTFIRRSPSTTDGVMRSAASTTSGTMRRKASESDEWVRR